MSSGLQRSGMLTKQQLIHLFNRFSFLTSTSEVKKRISDAVKDNQEAVGITTAIQEEILLEMGIDPRFGISCLGKVHTTYENDQELMIQFYRFVAREETACDEAELMTEEIAEKMRIQQKLQDQQLQMLKHMRHLNQDDQRAVLEALHRQMEKADYDSRAAFLTINQIEDIVRWKKTFLPRK